MRKTGIPELRVFDPPSTQIDSSSQVSYLHLNREESCLQPVAEAVGNHLKDPYFGEPKCGCLQVMVTAGANQGYTNLVCALLDEEDDCFVRRWKFLQLYFEQFVTRYISCSPTSLVKHSKTMVVCQEP